MTKRTRPLSELVVVDTSSARADRMWSRLRPRLEHRALPRRWAAPRAVLVAVALVLGFGGGLLSSRQAPRSGWAELHSSAGVTTVRLQDGSSLTLEPHTSLSVREQGAQSVEIALQSGRVQCDVTHAPDRAFKVAAAGHQVVVRGTRFWVELSRERNELAVEVQRGQVEVRGRGEGAEALLGAGQRWSMALGAAAAKNGADVASSNTGAQRRVGALADAGAALPPAAAPSPGANTPAVPITPTRPTTAARPTTVANPAIAATGERPAAPADAVRNRVAEQRSTAQRATAAEQGARALLDRANTARRQGDLAAAARAYEQLLRDHAGDARAQLAAFELGRLRMDEFHDVHGAIQVLQLAARADKEDASREDALARLVRAHEILRQGERCRSARAEYLQAYPTGTHVLAVLRACESLPDAGG